MLSQVWYNFPENFPCSNFSRVKIKSPCVYRRHHRGAPTRFESRARYVAVFPTSAAPLPTRAPFSSCPSLLCFVEVFMSTFFCSAPMCVFSYLL